MDKDFLAKFHYIVSALEVFAFIVGIIIVCVAISKFSYQMGELKERVNSMEEVVWNGKKITQGAE